MQLLGVGIIAGACFVKVPQIMALRASRSADGLSAVGFELENVVYIIHAAYGYLLRLPFGAYGEAGIMLIQNSVLLALLYRYAAVSPLRVTSMAALYVAMICAVVTGVADGLHLKGR